MSYHSTLRGATFVAASSSALPKCADGKPPYWTKTGYVCGGAGGSSPISLPGSVSVSADGRITGSASVSTSTSTSKPALTSSTTPVATTSPTPQAVRYGSLLWSDTHATVSPIKTYTAKPKTEVTPQASATVAMRDAERQTGMNWLPWALGAAGVGLVLFLVKRRS